ncbi:hypothetical protein MJO55_20930 [Mycolicibacterium rufum]|uniref:Uncharacterized protein n=1 Tax=Mycolicibacterium rufum TaxID=318424 RepID=A0A9X2YI98_9MYCO|nr:hypothetical protein [Mycolicibacterium rufum]KGI69485.1 hypothetical protein EU78_20875 [Mycolicibacterium rufum]MCV7073663.1 hypothetical protein [Mycolicibacterium rufum]ULP35693.1 hypothetical protein MJO55_20930 [Mycolicibacterium rufum]
MQIKIDSDSDDAQRLVRLREEVQARLEEMASIAARYLGPRSQNATVVYRPHGRETHAHPVHIEIIKDDPEVCITWYDDGSVEFSSPC